MSPSDVYFSETLHYPRHRVIQRVLRLTDQRGPTCSSRRQQLGREGRKQSPRPSISVRSLAWLGCSLLQERASLALRGYLPGGSRATPGAPRSSSSSTLQPPLLALHTPIPHSPLSDASRSHCHLHTNIHNNTFITNLLCFQHNTLKTELSLIDRDIDYLPLRFPH